MVSLYFVKRNVQSTSLFGFLLAIFILHFFHEDVKRHKQIFL